MIQLPSQFESQTRLILGEEYDSFVAALNNEPQVSIRINRRKISQTPDLNPVSWSQSGYYLANRPLFTMDPLFHAGAYYVQEASSMFLEQAYAQYMDVQQPFVLDLCAAPGGKSSHLASLMDGNGWLVSNEVIRTRANILAENMTKWGAPNVMVTNNDPKDFGHLNGIFDMIVIDAPCSGEGMFRKDEKAIEEWSVDNVKLCEERQRRIVADVFPALKEGGLLVYSTCTYNKDEDEENVKWIAENLGAEILTIQTDEDWMITSYGAGYHFFPHKTRGEGFFLALLRKTEDERSFKCKANKQKNKSNGQIPSIWKSCITGDADLLIDNDNIHAISSDVYDTVLALKNELKVLQTGIPFACIKGKDLIPETGLALSWKLNKEAFATVELSWKQAIAYLKKDNITIEDKPKGFVLLTYKNTPLGWVKNLGNRSNNLYPQEWRIRMQADENKYVNFL